MENGTVKWFNRRIGWGFIEREGQKDLFVHQFDVEGTISDGDKVEFEVESGVKPKAIHVKNLSSKQVKTEEPSSLIGTQPQAKFCGECGASLGNHRFCTQCGADSENIVKAKLLDEKKKEEKRLDDKYRELKLNEEQKKAVEYTYAKPLLVTAGPGAGKTKVVMERVKELLQQGLEDKEILCMTFTKSAEQTMQRRLSEESDKTLTGYKLKNQIKTFHALCYKLLDLERNQTFQILEQDRDNDNSTDLTPGGELWKKEFNKKFEKYTPEELKNSKKVVDKNTQVKKYLDDYKFKQIDPKEKDAFLDLAKAVSAFKIEKRNVNDLEEYLKNKSIDDDQYLQKLEDLKKYFIAYNKFLKTIVWDPKKVWFDNKNFKHVGSFVESYNDSSKNNVIRNIKDFDDYLLDTINGVQGPSERFENSNGQALKHIIIDEFQDNNYLQFELAKMLATKKAESHITVVGDINQCIYTFQGANPEIFNHFKEFYKDAEAEEITLKLNYRSTQKIIELANKLLKNGKYPYEPEPKESKTENESGKKIQIYEFSNIEDECNFFVETIIDEIGKKFKRRSGKEESKTFGDFIILTRTNEIRKKINYMLVEKFIPTRTKTYHKLEHGGKKNPGKYTTLLKNIIRELSDGKEEKFMKITTLEKFMKILVGECKTKCPGKYSEWTADNAIFYKVLHNLAWCYMKKYGADPLHPLTLKKFYDYITKFKDNRAIGEATWDDTAKKWTNVKHRDNIGDAVEIKTVHSVKGEQYPFVIISSSYQGHFPLEYKKRELRVPPGYLRYRRKHCMICNSELIYEEKIFCPNKECKCYAGIEMELHKMEERRLYYVAMTRAMNELIITVPKKIERDNVTHPTEVSEFLTDLDYQHDPENIDYHDMSEGDEVSQEEMDLMDRQHKQQWENEFQEKYNEVNEKLAKTKADADLDYEKNKLEQRIQELLREKNELLDEKKRHDVFDKRETSWEILEVTHDEPLDKTKIAYERIRKFWADRMGQEATPERKRHAEEQFKRITTAFENIEKGIGDTKI